MAEEKIIKPRLLVKGIRKSYESKDILKGIDLSVNPGETLALIGRSGVGKSTFFRCISVIEEPDEGNALLDGQEYLKNGNALYEPWEIRQNIVMVFQEYNLFPNITAMKNITIALKKTKKMSTKDAEELAREIAQKLGIVDKLNQYPNELSGGQAQRLALARAMVLQPKVLLLDEITSALGPETIVNVVAAIRDLRNTDTSGNMSIIIVTHLMRFAAEFADRVAFLHEGRVYEELPAKDFFLRCNQPETIKFVSSFQIPI